MTRHEPIPGQALARMSVADFVGLSAEGLAALVGEMAARYAARQGQPVQVEERRSWETSLPQLAAALRPLVEAGQRFDVLLEFQLPGEARRIDVILVGLNGERQTQLLIVELKGWNAPVQPVPGLGDRVFIHGLERAHPVPQVLGYQEDVRQFNTFGRQSDVGVACAVYMPNMEYAVPAVPGRTLERVYTRGQEAAFRDSVAEMVGHGACPEEAVRLDQSRTVQPVDMQRRLLQALRGQRAYELTEDQQVVAGKIWAVIRQAQREGGRSVIWVKGGPGTGKTAVALQLLMMRSEEFQKQNGLNGEERDLIRLALPTPLVGNVLRAGVRPEEVKDLGRLIAHPSGIRNAEVDLLVCDEAHRVKNGTFLRLINCGRTVVIFYDDGQVVRPDEGGVMLELRRHPQDLRQDGWRVYETPALTAQLRCGSAAYTRWVDALLGDEQVEAVPDYDFHVVDDIHRLERHVPGPADRMVGGFCWPWNEQEDDVRIGDWFAPWNPPRTEGADPAEHLQVRWVQDEAYRRHVGCIYTAQGLEFPRVAVLWGGDLVRRGDRWVAHLAPRRGKNPDLGNVDSAFHAFRADQVDGPDRALPYLLNVYRVLLTRGREGTAVYFTDADTRDYVRAQWAAARGVLAAGPA